MGDADKALCAGGNVGPAQIDYAVFGCNEMHVVAKAGYGAAWCQGGHDFRNRTFLGVRHARYGNKAAPALRIFYAPHEVKLPAACRVLACADAFSAHLPGKVDAYGGVH